MNKLALLTVTLALSFSAPAFAHDMAAMGDMDGDSRAQRDGRADGHGRAHGDDATRVRKLRRTSSARTT